MSLFDQRMSSGGMPLLMHHHGDAITYREPGCDPVDLTAVIGFVETRDDDTRDGRKQRQVRDVTICLDPASDYGGVATPAVNAIIEIGDHEYAVVTITSTSGTFARLALRQTRAIERSRQGLRS